MNHLETAGFRDYNQIIKTKEGNSTVFWEHRHFFMAREIEGVPPSFSLAEDTGAVGAFLAAFHRAARGYYPCSPYPGRMKWGKWPEILAKKCKEMELFGEMEGNSNGSFSLIYRRHLPYYLKMHGNRLSFSVVKLIGFNGKGRKMQGDFATMIWPTIILSKGKDFL